MTDPAATPETTPDEAGDAAKKARTDAIHVLARALWREGLGDAPVPAAAEGEDAAAQRRAQWKEKRRDYVRLATRLHKRLDRQGATLSVAAGGDEAADGDAD